MTRRFWLVAAIALLAACGGDDAASPAASSSRPPATTQAATVPTTTTPATTQAATVPTTTTPASTTSTAAPAAVVVGTTSTASCSEPPAFALDRPLREQFVDYLAACGFTQPEAACLFDHLDFEDPAVLAGDPDAMVPAFETCRIDVDRMAEIGKA